MIIIDILNQKDSGLTCKINGIAREAIYSEKLLPTPKKYKNTIKRIEGKIRFYYYTPEKGMIPTIIILDTNRHFVLEQADVKNHLKEKMIKRINQELDNGEKLTWWIKKSILYIGI
jgi:hypothetical protein